MPKVPFEPSKLKTLGKSRYRYVMAQLFIGVSFSAVTFNHCKDFAKKLREQRVSELKEQIAAVNPDKEAQKRLLKVYGLE